MPAAGQAMYHAGNGREYLQHININLHDDISTLGPTGRAMAEGNVSCCNDIAADERMAAWRAPALAHGYRSSAAFPLRVSGKITGTFNIYSGEKDFFGKEELILLEKLAHDIAFALELAERDSQRTESEARYRSLFFNNHAPMMLLDPVSGRIIDVNPAAASWYGWPVDTMKSMNITEINTLTPEQIQSELQAAREQQRNHFVCRHRRADGSVRDVEVYSGPIAFGSDRLLYSIIHDITMRRQTEIALENAVREKEALLAELQHRIKNSLSMITSMIRIEADSTAGLPARASLEKLHGRIGTLANLYSMLYANRDADVIQLDRYLDEIIQSSKVTWLTAGKEITINAALNPLSLDFKRASSAGLILNELLTNAFKYAFNGRDQGHIDITLRHDGGMIHLEVGNDGCPLPEGFDPEQSQGMGLILVTQLARQLGGRAECVSGSMVIFRAVFPYAAPAG